MESDKKIRRWIVAFIAVVTFFVASNWHPFRQQSGLEPVASRRPAPDMTLPQLGGGEWRLADHRGQAVLINYWATWCGPCRDELPDLMQVARASQPKGLAVVGISLDSARTQQARAQTVQTFADLYRMPYPIAFPDERIEMESADIGLPTTVLIDRQGRAAKTYQGEVGRADLARDVAALLAEN